MVSIGARCHATIRASSFLLILLLAAFDASAATLVVNGTADASPPATSDGVCSLREAMQSIINAANFGDCLNSGGAYGTADTVNFNITGAGVHTINAVATLPVITKPMLIDGYSQPGATANTLAIGNNAQLKIEINGAAMTPAFTDLFEILGGGGTTIRGLVVNRVSGQSVYIGFSGASNNNIVAGNWFGVDATGMTYLGGTNTSIRVDGSSNTIGGTTPAARNVIAGGSDMVYMFQGGGNVVQGNYIGTNAAGTAALFGAGPVNGIKFALSLGNTIGGSVPGAGNVIVAPNIGISLGDQSNNTTIQGNFIGTNAAGSAALGVFVGVQLTSVAGVNIGGSLPGEGNIISGGGLNGIDVRSGNIQTAILGNKIGTDVTGTAGIPNQCGIAVAPALANPGIHIGGSGAGEGNIIAFNGTHGVAIVDGTGTLVQRNSIFSNGGLGIAFAGCGSVAFPTPNDPGDADTGANNLQNYPVIASAQHVGSNAVVAGTLNSTPSTLFEVELFANAACDASGNGEGQAYLGTASVTTNSSGIGLFGPGSFPVPPGLSVITATATGPGNNTSEFSQCFAFPAPPALQSAASRRVHGAAGTFDLPLSLANIHNPATEPRQGPAQTIVFTFDKPVTAATAAVTEGGATAAAPTFSGNEAIVALSGVVDQQYVTVALTNIASADGGTGGSASVRVGFLVGDVNQSRVVSVADLGLVNAQLSQVVTAANYLRDVNATGTLTVADKGVTNANLTRALPPP
jgi:CSLREA domain-containing protein